MEKRVRLYVAYDGTAYHGWQIQNNCITIEGELNRAISDLVGRETTVIGASRTDAGVHSLGSVAVFDTDSRIPSEKMAGAINARLPQDIRIVKSDEVPSDWHPRHVDCRKTYEYHIYYGRIMLPTKRLYCHFIYKRPDIKAMKAAACSLVGEHDFAAFCAADSQAESTVRTVYSIEVEETINGDHQNCKKENADHLPAESGEIVIRVTGNGFLYNMVRIIAGTLLDAGQGKKKPEDMTAILESLDRSMSGPTLPANGLFLVGYEFAENDSQNYNIK